MNGLTPRMITLFIAFPIVIVIFIILGILILRKDSKYWGNRFFASFFWLTALTLFFNLLYLPSTNEIYIESLNLVTAAIAMVSFAVLILGTLVITKGEDVIIHNKISYAFFGIIILLALIPAFFPEGMGVYTVDNDPRWYLPLGLYYLVFSQLLVVTIYYFSLSFYTELSPEMKTKLKRYLIGVAFIDLTFISVTIDNLYIFGESYALIGAALNFSVVIGALLIYFGIIRK